MQCLCQWGNLFCKLPLRRLVLVMTPWQMHLAAYSGIKIAGLAPIVLEVFLGALAYAYPTIDLFRRACTGVVRDSGGRRNGAALRHLDGGHPAHDPPARSRGRGP